MTSSEPLHERLFSNSHRSLHSLITTIQSSSVRRYKETQNVLFRFEKSTWDLDVIRSGAGPVDQLVKGQVLRSKISDQTDKSHGVHTQYVSTDFEGREKRGEDVQRYGKGLEVWKSGSNHEKELVGSSVGSLWRGPRRRRPCLPTPSIV